MKKKSDSILFRIHIKTFFWLKIIYLIFVNIFCLNTFIKIPNLGYLHQRVFWILSLLSFSNTFHPNINQIAYTLSQVLENNLFMFLFSRVVGPPFTPFNSFSFLSCSFLICMFLSSFGEYYFSYNFAFYVLLIENWESLSKELFEL